MAQREHRLLLIWLLLFVLSPAAGWVVYAQAKRSDCSPRQGDGQCGLSTFMGAVMGAGVAGALLLGGTVFIAVQAAKRK